MNISASHTPAEEPKDNNNGWISVKDRMPEKCEEVLVWIECGSEIPLQAYYNAWKDTWYVSAEITTAANNIERLDGRLSYNVTHWQPLPSPPNA